MAQFEIYLFTFLTVLVGHVNSDTCFDYQNTAIRYCPYGCCGQSGYQYCCTYLYGGTIAGIVVGCLVGLGLLIGAIVFCCCLHRRRAANGQVIHANTNPWFSTTSMTTTTNGMMTTQLPPGVYPPSYQPTPQMAGGYPPYMPNNAASEKQYCDPPPSYNQVARS